MISEKFFCHKNKFNIKIENTMTWKNQSYAGVHTKRSQVCDFAKTHEPSWLLQLNVTQTQVLATRTGGANMHAFFIWRALAV